MTHVLADVVSEALIDAPIDALDLSYWVFNMGDRDYQRCARGHLAAGSSPLPGGGRASINVESVGGHLLVQHYEPEVLTPHHVRMVSHASNMWIFRLFPARVRVTWEITLHPRDGRSCTFRDHIRVEHGSRVLWLLSRLALVQRIVQRHDDEETPHFAANCRDICRRRAPTAG